jgi:LysM repeat protein
MQQALKDPAVRNYLQAQYDQQQAQIAAASAANPLSPADSYKIGLEDVSIVGGRTHVKLPNGSTIALPEGVAPEGMIVKNTVSGNPNEGQYYIAGTGSDGRTYHYYASGQAVAVSNDGGGGAGLAASALGNGVGIGAAGSVVTPNPAGNTGGAAAPGEPAGEMHIGHPASESSASKAAAFAGSAAGTQYTVQAGDTMWDIAQRNATTLGELVAKNPHIENPDLIHPGDKINLGASDAGAAIVDDFPTTSSYPPVEGQGAASGDSQKGKNEGWVSGTSSTDPANNAIMVVEQPDTDPLKINDKKHDA